MAPEKVLRVLMNERFLSSFIHLFIQQCSFGAVLKLILLILLYLCAVLEIEW